MDEEALRAMMPTSFGKKRAPKKPSQPTSSPLPATTSNGLRSKASTTPTSSSSTLASSSIPSSALQQPSMSSSSLGESSSLGRRAQAPKQADGDGDEEDDGLTTAERAANAELERHMAEKKDNTSDSEDSDDDDDSIGPPPPPSLPSMPSSHTFDLPPMTNQALFSGQHSKTLSALAVDGSGARFCVGSYDYSISFYDFGGMKSNLAPFRKFEPSENYPVHDLSFSSDSSLLLVISGTSQAKLLTRDGAEVGTCKKGDPYLRDMRQTKGHVSELSCGLFRPTHPNTFVTGGSDSTIRIWDTSNFDSKGHKDIVVVKSKQRGNRTKLSSIQFSDPGQGSNLLFGGALDGQLSYWDLRSNLNAKPRGSVERAHLVASDSSDAGADAGVGGGITSIAVHDNMVASRASDHTMKLWDLRSFRTPLATAHDLPNLSQHTAVIFNPNDRRSILTCVSAVPGGSGQPTDSQRNGTEGGRIVVLPTIADSNAQLQPVQTYRVSPSPSLINVSPIRMHWCQHTDQLFTTFRDGSLMIYYDEARSQNGIRLAVARPSKRASEMWGIDPSSVPEHQPEIYLSSTETFEGVNPSSSSKRRKLAKIRQDPLLSNLPQPPISGPGKSGRIGASATQHIVQSIYNPTSSDSSSPKNIRDEDPRQALLKYQPQQGEQNRFTKAWNDTQPNPIFDLHNPDVDTQDMNSDAVGEKKRK